MATQTLRRCDQGLPELRFMIEGNPDERIVRVDDEHEPPTFELGWVFDDFGINQSRTPIRAQ